MSEDNYVAWLQFHKGIIRICDSDAVGAFKVYRQSKEGRDDYDERFELAKQRVAIVERVMKLNYIKQTRDTERGEERFVARDDVITAIHNIAKVSRAADCGPHPLDNAIICGKPNQ